MYCSYISYTHQPSSHHHAIFHHFTRVSSTNVDARPAHRVSTTNAGAVIVRRHSYADERWSKRAVGSVSCHAVPVHFQFVSCRAHAWHEYSGAQYWGAGNTNAVERVLAFIMLYAGGLSLVFFALTLLIPETLMSIMTNDITLIAIGSQYLRVSSVSYLFIGLSQMY